MFDVKIIEARKGGGKARIVGGCFRNTNLGAALLLRETSREYLRPPFPHISQFPTHPILFIHPILLLFKISWISPPFHPPIQPPWTVAFGFGSDQLCMTELTPTKFRILVFKHMPQSKVPFLKKLAIKKENFPFSLLTIFWYLCVCIWSWVAVGKNKRRVKQKGGCLRGRGLSSSWSKIEKGGKHEIVDRECVHYTRHKKKIKRYGLWSIEYTNGGLFRCRRGQVFC